MLLVYTMAEGKFPKKPEYGNYLDTCRKEFRRFRDSDEQNIEEFFHNLDTPSTQEIIDPKILTAQRETIESVKKLLREDNEELAFSLFYNTFPTCLPHRSRR